MRLIVLLLILLSQPLFAKGKKNDYKVDPDRRVHHFHLDINNALQSRSIKTDASASTNANTSSALDQAFEFKALYLFSQHSAIVMGYQRNFGFISDGQSSGQRFGYRYYFTNSPLSEKLRVDHFTMKTSGTVHYFLEGDFKTRDFEISNAILRFTGPGFGGGADFMVGQNNYITLMLEYSMLTNGTIRTLSSMDFSIGYGFIL